MPELVLETPLWPLALYAALVAVAVGGVVGVSRLLGERHSERATGELYESGVPVTPAPRRLAPQFYVVAVLFVVFDLEAVFLYAWAVSARSLGWSGYVEVAIFVAVLLAALVYVVRTGALDFAETARQRQQMAARRVPRSGR